MILEKKRNLFDLLIVLSAFVASRLIYDWAGITFDTTYLFSWQVIDPVLLKTDLLRSVFYLHSQPPLWNFFLGTAMRFFPENTASIFNGVYYALGVVFALSIYQLALALRFPSWLSVIVAIFFVVSPSAILYENTISYAYPVTVALTASGVFLFRFIETKQTYWGVLFFSALVMIALTWSFFHLVWILGVVVFLYFVWNEKKKTVLAALIPVLLLVGWYAKNAVIVGDFTASSWMGMNLSKIVMLRFSEKELEQMFKEKKLSELATLPAFRNPLVYLKYFPETPKTGIPVLDNPETSLNGRNHHHLVYAEASRTYLKDSLKLIYERPDRYLRSILQASYIYFHSTSDYEFLETNRARIDSFDRAWNRVFYGQWNSGESAGERFNTLSVGNIGWGLIVIFVTALAGGFIFLKKKRRNLDDPANILVFFMFYAILFATLIGTTMDIGENNRFRFTVDPFLAMLFVFVVRARILENRKVIF